MLQTQYDQLSQRHEDLKRDNQARLDAECTMIAKLREEVDQLTQQYAGQKKLNKYLVAEMAAKSS